MVCPPRTDKEDPMPPYDRSYQVFSGIYTREEGPYEAYGIRTHAGAIHDISTDRELVEGMAALFEWIRLDPSRAGDLIEHMLP